MTTPKEIQTVVERNHEVLDALEARRGDLYALKVSMFVACTKMHNEFFGTAIPAQMGFVSNLLTCFGITSDAEIEQFINESLVVRQAQRL